MDLEWLLPEQIEQILRLCELSSMEDLSVAANILEQHAWDFEQALHDVVKQNDEIQKQEVKQAQQRAQPAPAPVSPPSLSHNYWEEDFEIPPEHYSALDSAHPLPALPSQPQSHSHILAQQNHVYAQMEKNHARKKEEELRRQEEEQKQLVLLQEREKEYAAGRAEFQQAVGEFEIKFRLAHRVAQWSFSPTDKVSRVFKYVSCCLRDSFEHVEAEFDLAQTFPALSLKGKQEQSLEEVFGESRGEVLIVREQ